MMSGRWATASLWLSLVPSLLYVSEGFVSRPSGNLFGTRPLISSRIAEKVVCRQAQVAFIDLNDYGDENDDDDESDLEEEEEEEEEAEEDEYTQKASSEFLNDAEGSNLAGPRTSLDWGGALGKLRERVGDIETGDSKNPSSALFRLMTSETPNQAIGNFVTSANPQVVAAMSGAVNSLLGGLSNPSTGIETIIKASTERIGSLCFQLQMTGYMFRNAEYVLALKDIMKIRGSATLEDYKEAFDRLDKDGSGFIESSEIEELLSNVYDGEKVPKFEVKSFLDFFDSNNDGKISWKEFEKGLGDVTEKQAAEAVAAGALLPALDDYDDDLEDDDMLEIEPNISGMIEIELQDGEVVKVEAKEYIESLKKEAQQLKEALRRENGMTAPNVSANGNMMPGGSITPPSANDVAGIAEYIASRQGDVKSLTEGIKPEIVETMKRLVDFVLEGGPRKKQFENKRNGEQAELEIPGSALQQLALWQLVLGYRLREAEATGDYMKLMDN